MSSPAMPTPTAAPARPRPGGCRWSQRRAPASYSRMRRSRRWATSAGLKCSQAGIGSPTLRTARAGAKASGARHQLDAEHPLLLLELADDVDQDILRDRVDVAQPVHPRPYQLADLGHPIRQLPYDSVTRDRLSRKR